MYNCTCVCVLVGAVGQVLRYRLFIAEVWVQSQGNPCGICGPKSSTLWGSSPSNSMFTYRSSFHECCVFYNHPWSLRCVSLATASVPSWGFKSGGKEVNFSHGHALKIQNVAYFATLSRMPETGLYFISCWKVPVKPLRFLLGFFIQLVKLHSLR